MSGVAFLEPHYDVTRLFDYVQAMVPNVTTDIVSLVIWATIEDFYTRSAYRREHVYWCLEPGQAELRFDPYDDDWRVCRFMGFEGLSRPKFIPPGQIIDLTCPVPDVTRSGEAILALKPNSYNTVLSYDIWTTYWEALFHGAMYRLHLQPGKPWSDMKAMELHGRLYRSGIASARADAQMAHIREGTSWSFPPFAKGGRANGG